VKERNFYSLDIGNVIKPGILGYYEIKLFAKQLSLIFV